LLQESTANLHEFDMKELLDNFAWHALSGPHLKFSVGGVDARRYAPGLSRIVGFANPQSPNFDALTPYCESGEHFYCGGWSGAAPAGWRIDAETTMIRMVWDSHLPEDDPAPEAFRLERAQAPQAFELASLTRPGPFGLRTIELGEYFGVYEGERLIAMAGERMHAGEFREISGVCTHPDFQGRGLARKLTLKLIRRQMQRDEHPFLSVMSENVNARRLYERMGFQTYRETVLRVVSRI
jgi:GNAT superfamily N-acetyltransferase